MNYIKKTVLFLIVCFACLFAEVSASPVNKGEYIIMGSFNGENILWRCIGENENGYYFLSDRVLCEMSFDEDTNIWRDSSIREYLNNEFLTDANFTDDEMSLVGNAFLRSASGMITQTSDIHIYDDNFSTSVQNIEETFGIETQDRFFLPSVSEISLTSDIKTFGADYYMGKDSEDKYVSYYLRDALSFSPGTSFVRYVSKSFDFGYVQYNYSFRDKLIRAMNSDSKAGIRPAFYLGDGFSVTEGNGSRDNPYRLTGELHCTIKTERDVMFEGDSAIPEISYNGEGNYILKYYCNGVEYDSGEPFKAGYGNNKLYAAAKDEDGNVVFTSESITVTGIRICEDYTLLEENFDGENAFYSKFSNYATATGDSIEKITDSDFNHGKSLCIISDKPGTYINTKNFSFSDGVFVIKTDVKFSDYNFSARYPFDICTYKDGNKQWLTPLKFYPDKTVKLFETENDRIVYTGINPDKWYTITLIIDVGRCKLTAAINNEIVAYDESIKEEFDYISYVNYSISAKSGKSKFFLDNIKIFSAENEVKTFVKSINVKNNGTAVTDKLHLKGGDITIEAEFEKICSGKMAMAYVLWRDKGILCAVDSVILDENNLRGEFILENIPADVPFQNLETGILIWENGSLSPLTKRINVFK